MKSEIGLVLDLVQAARNFVDGISERVAEASEKKALLQTAIKMGLLDIDGQRMATLAADVLRTEAAFRAAEDSVSEAEKQLAHAATCEAESLVASMIEEPEEREKAVADVAEALGQARARVEEARAFAKLCDRILADLRFPKLVPS